MLSLSNIKITLSPTQPWGTADGELLRTLSKALGLPQEAFRATIRKKSLDARRGHPFAYLYSVDVECRDEESALRRLKGKFDALRREAPQEFEVPESSAPKHPVVVGFGPAGMFCALVLARAGLEPIILERGRRVEERVGDVENFCRTRKLNPDSNVQFGEGGAGTFSDGKLATGVRDRDGYGRFILREMVKAGAPESILYDNKPHVGTDRLRVVVAGLREEIIRLGGKFLFETKLTDFEEAGGAFTAACVSAAGDAENSEAGDKLVAPALFLGIGHSARDTFEMLRARGLRMEPKPFAVGLRVEHKQALINEAQYREYARCADLGPADYRLTAQSASGRGVYTFCMCPGGAVMAATSEEGMVVTNGMSNLARDEENANSAVLVQISPEDYAPFSPISGDVLAGVAFQRELERRAFKLGGEDYRAPAQRVEDYLANRPSEGFGAVRPSFPCGVTPANLRTILPGFVGDPLAEGLVSFGTRLPGFDSPDAVLTGVESRSSSPVRIVRDEKSLQANVRGIYPMGEGAGYAGGIMSAAMDGMRAALAYLEESAIKAL